MSKTVDERVVQMDFDNKRFEKNVDQSISTIDRLKSKLNFDKSAKSFENITASAKKVNLSGIDKALDTVKVNFSAMQVAGITALVNLTNTAIYTGKRISSALTVDPIKLGLGEYETQINAVQTILANTSTKGTTLDQVNSALNELNRYADLTIYNFTEMTRNIGTFTAAGIGLNTSVSAIKGIANLAAVSGSTSQQASTAMYQLSQALAAGTVKLQDWNSVVNAGMGGEIFQNALKETAKIHGIKIDEIIKEEGSFRESLKEGWLTASVLTETLAKFTGDLNEEQLRSIGYTKEQIDAIIKMGNMANDAATKVKTFTQLADTLKEAAQSGWTQSWQIIIGNFEEAKDLFTMASNTLQDLINKSAETRNRLLTGGLMSEWGQFANVWSNTMGDGIAGIEAYQEIVKQVARDHGVEIDSMISDMGSFEKSLKKGWLTTDIMNTSMDQMADKMSKLSDEELKAEGYTKAHIEAIASLSAGMKSGSASVGNFSAKVGELSGREHIISSIQNSFQALMSVINPVRSAFQEFFPPMTSERLYNMTVMLDNFTSKLVLSSESSDKLNRSFRGVFAIVELLTSIITGGLKAALTLISKLTGQTDLDILSLTATVGDSLVAFRDWVTENNFIARGFDGIINAILGTITVVKQWIKSFSEIPAVREAVKKFGEVVDQGFTNAGKNVKETAKLISEFIDEIRGLDTISFANVSNSIKKLKTDVLQNLFGMSSGFKVLENPITAFKNTMTKGFKDTGKDLSDLQIKMGSFVDFTQTKFSDLDIGKILTVGLGGSLVVTLNSFSKFMDAFKNSITGTMTAVTSVVKSYTMTLKANTIFKIAAAISVLAIAIAALTFLDQDKLWSVLAAILSLGAGLVLMSSMMAQVVTDKNFVGLSLIAVSLSASLLLLAIALKQMQFLQVDKAIANIVLLGIMATGLMALVAKLSIAAPKLSTGSMLLIAIAAALNIMVGVLNKLNNLPRENLEQSMDMLLSSMLGLVAVSLAAQKLKLGGGVAIIAAASSLLILVKAIKVIANVDTKDITENMDSFIVVLGLFATLMVITKLAGKNAKSAGLSIAAISLSLILLSKAIGTIVGINIEDVKHGLLVVSTLLLVFSAVIAVSKLAGGNSIKAGAMIAIMGAAILEMTVAIAFLASLDGEGLDRATKTIVQLQLCFGLLIAVSKLANNAKGTIIAIATTIGVLAVSLGALSMVDQASLRQATESLTVVMGMLGLLIAMSSKATGSIPVLLTLGLLIGELAVILYAMDKLNISGSINVADSLSVLMLSLSASLGVLALVGTAVVPALVGIALLDAFIINLALVLGGLGALVNEFPIIETWVSKGIPMFEKLGYGLGSFFGNILSGLLSGSTSNLTDIGKNLDLFIKSLMPFFESIKSLDVSTIDGVKTLVDTMALVKKITGRLVGGDNMDEFGTELTNFGKAMVEYSKSVMGLNTTSIGASVASATSLAELLKVMPNTGGVAAGLLGDNTFSNFKMGLVGFGEAMVAYSKIVMDLNVNSIGPSVKSASQLNELLKVMPNTGGVSAFFAGDNTFGKFKTGLVGFGEAMVEYANTVFELKTGSIGLSVNAANKLTELLKAIPNAGGLSSMIMGDNTFYHFKVGLVGFGKAIVEYSDVVANIQMQAILNSAKAAKEISNLSDFDFNGLLKMTEALKAVANTPINDAANETASNLIKAFVTGIGASKDEILKKFDDVVASLRDGLVKVSNIQTEFEQAGKFCVDGFVNGLSSRMSTVSEAAANIGNTGLFALNNSLDINSPSWLTTLSGRFFGTGFANGIGDKTTDAYNAALATGQSALNGLNAGIGNNIPKFTGNYITDVLNQFSGLSKGGKKLGDDLMNGVSSGIDSGSKKAKGSAGKAAKTLYDITKEWIDEEKYYKRLSLDQELAKWEDVQAKFKIGSEERKKIDREVYRVRNEIIEETFANEKKLIDDDRYFKRKTLSDELAYWIEIQEKYVALGDEYAKQKEEAERKVFELREEVASDTYSKEKEWIDDKKYYNQLSLKEELAYWKGIQKQFLAGSEQRKNAAKEVYRVEKELAKEAFDNAKSWISERKYYNDLSLAEELYAWERIRDAYDEDAAERIEAEREVYRIEQDINQAREDLTKSKLELEEDAAQQRIDLEEDYYDKVKTINDQLAQDISDLNKEYDDAVKSRADTISKSYNLFDYAKMNNGVDGQVLLTNLESQLVALEDWQKNINGLADRGIEEGLLDELRGMGPSSAAEIKALNGLTDEQLTQYVALWQQKQAMAKDQAILELEKMKSETADKIAELTENTNKQLTEYKTAWDTQLADLNTKVAAKLVELQNAFDTKIGELSSETKRKVRDLTSDIEDAIEVSSENIVDDVIDLTQNIQTAMETPDWVSIGTNIIAGIQKGLNDKAAELAETAARVARAALEAAEEALDINSPSGEFANTGMYCDMGFANGLLKYAHLVKNGAKDVGKTALSSIQGAVLKVSDLIENGMDSTPVIRPVLDLTSVENGMKQINSVFGKQQAVSVASSINANRAAINQNDSNIPIKTGDTKVEYVQNNYSPKALSRIEIYRQTKNQISTLERMVES